jgi:threonine/homoserine/homoserine lactone efflux protein
MPYVIHLTLGVIISFLASFSLGPVNMAVLEASLHGRKARAIAIGAGAAFVDFIFCILAVGGVHLVISLVDVTVPDWFYLVIRWAGLPVLVYLGITALRKKVVPEHEEHLQPKKRGIGAALFFGMTLNLVNPLLFPFWLGLTTYLRGIQWLGGEFSLLATFSLGAGLGCFALLFTVALLSRLGKELMSVRTRQLINKGIGIFYLVFAGYLLFTLLKAHFGF